MSKFFVDDNVNIGDDTFDENNVTIDKFDNSKYKIKNNNLILLKD